MSVIIGLSSAISAEIICQPPPPFPTPTPSSHDGTINTVYAFVISKLKSVLWLSVFDTDLRLLPRTPNAGASFRWRVKDDAAFHKRSSVEPVNVPCSSVMSSLWRSGERHR